jgi:hypothetical protein
MTEAGWLLNTGQILESRETCRRPPLGEARGTPIQDGGSDSAPAVETGAIAATLVAGTCEIDAGRIESLRSVRVATRSRFPGYESRVGASDDEETAAQTLRTSDLTAVLQFRLDPDVESGRDLQVLSRRETRIET